MLKSPMCTIRRGPILLARSKKIGSREDDMFSGESVFGKTVEHISTVDTNCPGLLALERITLKVDGVEKTYLMCDYAYAANFNVMDTSKYFTVYI